jgi:hypothetical protein
MLTCIYEKYLIIGDFNFNENPELYLKRHAVKPHNSTTLTSTGESLSAEINVEESAA